MLITGYLRDYLVKPDNLDIVFPVVLSGWFILSAHWLYNWITHRKYHLKIRLHRLLTFIWFIKISWLVFTYMTVVFRIVPPLYRSDPTRPGPAGFTFWVWGLTHYVFETLVYFSLILISKGMSITRSDLGKKEKNSLTVMMHAIMWGSVLSMFNIRIYAFLLIFNYIFVQRFCFVAIETNLNHLCAFLNGDQLRYPLIMSTEVLPVLKSKIKLFVSMRRIISVYFMVLALLEVSMIGLLNYGFEFQPWTEFLAQEGKDLLLAISLAHLFKLRPPPNITPASDGGSDISLEKLSSSKDSLSTQVVISYGGSLRNIQDIHTIPLFLGLKDESRESS